MDKKASVSFSFLLATPLLVFIAMTVLGFDGLYGQDSYEYFRYSNKLKAFLLGGEYPGNLVWPKGYLFLSAILSFVFSTALAGQLISLICFYLGYYYLKQILILLYGPSQKIRYYSILAFLLAPYLLRLSYVMMADTLAILCLLATSFYALQYAKDQKGRTLLLCVFWASFGIFSRYATLVPIAPLAIWTAYNWVKIRKPLQLLSLLIPITLLLIHQYLEADGSDFLGHHFIENWSATNYFKSEFFPAVESQLPTSTYLLPNILYYLLAFFHPGFFFLAGICFLLYIPQLKKLLSSFPPILWLSLLLYSFFLAGITFQGSRYISLSYPLFAILLYPAFEFLLEKLKWRSMIFWALAIIQFALFIRAALPSYHMNQLERQTAETLKEYEGETLYTFELDVGLIERGIELNYLSLWEREYESFEAGALVLFNEIRIAETFEGKNPMNNWEAIKKEFKLIELAQLEGGWKLYRLEK